LRLASSDPAFARLLPAAVPSALVALVLLAACGDGATAPRSTGDGACTRPDGVGVVTLGVAEATRVDCSAGGTVFDVAPGASYLLVPQFATAGGRDSLVPYAFGLTSVSASLSAARAPAGARAPARARVPAAPAVPLMPSSRVAASAGQSAMPGGWQARFDARLLEWARASLRDGAWDGPWTVAPPAATVGRPDRATAQASAVPAVGSVRDFHVLATLAARATFKAVAARLAYVGQNLLLYVDTLAAPNGLAPDDVAQLGRLFDQTLTPIDLAGFGQPSDIDGNGRLVMLMTPVVNGLTPAADCATEGYVAGFFTGFDLASTTANSNRGEVFYTIAPDPDGVASCPHTVNTIERIVPATYLHELQHLISFSQHVVVHGGHAAEEGWLDEGLSIVAEELGAHYYEAKYPPPTGRSDPAQLFPDSAQGFIAGLLSNSYGYLLRPDTVTLTLHSAADGGLAWRGGDWLLLRWLGDHQGPDFYQRLEATALTGTANVAAAAGEPFGSLFADFGIALWADSLPDVPRSEVPARDRFATRNLREMYAALFRATGGGADPEVPLDFPITERALGGANASAAMVPGTVSYYRLDAPAGGRGARVRFATPGGGALPAALHPQVAIFRIPPGI
jgi:hypothetical protein